MPVLQWLPTATLIVIVSVLASPDLAGGQSYVLAYEISSTEQVLKRAAVESPQGHSSQDPIQREVYDITLLLDQALRASEKHNDAQNKIMLSWRGRCSNELRLIQELLPNVSA